MNKLIQKTILTFLLSLVTIVAYSQGEANVWYFGNGAGLDFNFNPPVQLENGNANLTDLNREGVGGMSDGSGNLLFYTDGRNVYNKNHVLMTNGFGLLGGDGSSTQAGLSLKVNGSTTQYFIISTDNGDASYYSIVDMTLSTGLGDITTKNSPLVASGNSEAVVSVPVYDASNNPTGENWIIFHDHSSASYRVYKTNGATIAFSGTYTVGFAPTQKALIMKTNACFNKLAISFYNHGRVEILPFNNVTGVISTPSLILNRTGAGVPFLNIEVYGIEFSPNDQFLYVSESGLNNRKTVYQFDITLGTGTNPPAVMGSKSFYTGDGTVSRFGHLQLAPNGKIYIPGFNFSTPTYLSEIPNPNVAWTLPSPSATEFVFKKYTYNVKIVGEGLPVFSQDLLRSIKIYYANACEGGTTNFSYIFGGVATSQTWNFGDPASGVLNTSASATPSHTFNTAGTYTVSLSVVDQCGRTRTQSINLIVKTGATYTKVCNSPCVKITGTGSNASNYAWDTNINGTYATVGSTYNYCGTIPTTVYVKDPTPLANYIVGNTTGSDNFGADIGFTYFELYTSVSITEFQVIGRLNGQNTTFTIKNEALTTTYWTGVAPLSVTGTTYTFNPNTTLSAGRYVLHTSNVNYAFRNSGEDDGNRDVSGVIDILGEKTGTKGGSFFNIKLALPDPCGIRAIPLTVADVCSPLGVDLLSFTGIRKSNYNEISWAGINPVNFNHYELEYSTDGVDFDYFDSYTYNPKYKEYHFTNQVTYYRLKMVDNDNSYSYSNVIIVYSNVEDIIINPNPSENTFVVVSYTPFDYSLYTIDGKVLMSDNDVTKVEIGKDFNAGVYILHTYTRTGINKTYKLVKK
jgi:hypothetical protein